MQHVKTPVRKHHASPIAFPWAKLQNRFVQTQNPGAQLIVSVDWLASLYISVYHARNRPFFRTRLPRARP